MTNESPKINDSKKTTNNKINVKGGKVLASGGFGCVFSPALKCKSVKKRNTKNVSKLMTEKHAIEEYEEINKLNLKIKSIKQYEDYFLTYDVTLCKPEKLTQTDLTNYTKKCTALQKDDILKKNINQKLDKLMLLNMPNGGLPIDDYIYMHGSFQKIYNVHIKLIDLLQNGIVHMNNKNIYHCDIKDSNILVDDTSSELKTRLIDWGLSTEYIPFKQNSFPKTWRNRPFQFNVPFSIIIFSDSFVEKYKKYFEEGDVLNEESLKPFIIEYIAFWMKERGPGHYKFMNEIMYALYSNDFLNILEDDRPKIIETQITLPYIVNYIVNVLIHFTRFKEDGSINLREYLDNVFIKIVDIWGFLSSYYPLIELLFNNYSNLKENEMELFNHIKYIYIEYLYSPRHEAINMENLYADLKILGNLIHTVYKNDIKSNHSIATMRSLNKQNYIAKGFAEFHKKTRNNRNKRKNITNKSKEKRSSIIFKRKQKLQNFQKPYFLSILK